jgi:DNA-binding response OmpR family regulator
LTEPGRIVLTEETAAAELRQILIIEENPMLRADIRQGLGPQFRLIEVTDGAGGARMAEEIVPDLIITNMALGKVDGAELCRRLKANELTSHVPVVIVSAYNSEICHVRALEAGADDYIVTPFRPSLLRARVDNLLESRHKLRERFHQEITLQPRGVAITQTDAQFLRRLTEVIERHLCDYEFDVEMLAQKVAISRRQLFRKLKAVTDCTASSLIRAMRLQRAAQLLRDSRMTVTEVTYAVGFSDLKHFRTVFRDHFGLSPSEYGKKS